MPKAPGCHETAPQLQELICQKAGECIPLSKSSLFINCPFHTIQSIVKWGTERGYHKNAPWPGRPLKLNDWALQRLNLCVVRNWWSGINSTTGRNDLQATPQFYIYFSHLWSSFLIWIWSIWHPRILSFNPDSDLEYCYNPELDLGTLDIHPVASHQMSN